MGTYVSDPNGSVPRYEGGVFVFASASAVVQGAAPAATFALRNASWGPFTSTPGWTKPPLLVTPPLLDPLDPFAFVPELPPELFPLLADPELLPPELEPSRPPLPLPPALPELPLSAPPLEELLDPIEPRLAAPGDPLQAPSAKPAHTTKPERASGAANDVGIMSLFRKPSNRSPEGAGRSFTATAARPLLPEAGTVMHPCFDVSPRVGAVAPLRAGAMRSAAPIGRPRCEAQRARAGMSRSLSRRTNGD